MTRETGTAGRQGRLWSVRAEAWSEIELQERPRYAAAIERLGIESGQSVLDLGCGSGVFLSMAAERGARVSGLDASEALLEIARRRVPDADLRAGDLQFLPYEDDSFDVVTGFNTFFFASDMTAALREAGRVARPGARVLIQVWGRPERCDLTPMVQAVARLRGAERRAGPTLFKPGVLEAIATEAGLSPGKAFDLSTAAEYPSEADLLRLVLAPGPMVAAIEAVGEEAVSAAVLETLAPSRTPQGGYRLENEWHYLIARA